MLNFQQITMPYLAALVPPGWDVTHVDEAVEPVDLSAQVDLVGITFHTPSAAHVYDLAAEFRQRGVAVALGGPHVSLVPDEAQQHADAIFVGEAELHWPRFLEAFARGQHRPRYVSTEAPSLDHAPMARKDLYHRHDLTAGRLFATRGCAYACEFCAVAVMYPHPVRKRPVAAVAAEYASFPGKVIIFWDDNLANDREYAKTCSAPSRRTTNGGAARSAYSRTGSGFLEAAARSGCKQLFIGLESVCQESMNEVHKGFNRVEQYARLVERVHSYGIAVQAGIVFGFDHDTEAVFAETLDFLEQAGVDNATFNILTPYPGTPLFHRLDAEGRILSRDWSRYNGREHVVFQPRHMSPETLLHGFRYANERFYSVQSILPAPVPLPRRLVVDRAAQPGVHAQVEDRRIGCKRLADV